MILKQPRFLLFASLAVGIILRLFFIFGNHYISPDGTQYALLGYHIFHDGQYVSEAGQFPDIIQPPLYPLTLGVFTLIFSPELSGKIASMIFGLFLIWAIFEFSLRISKNKSLAAAAAFLIAVNPAMVSVSSQVASEALFLLLLFLMFALVWLYLQKKNWQKLLWAALATGGAFLTRPEALLYFGMIVLILLLWRKPFLHIAGYVLIVSTVILAYSSYTHSKLGYWTISPKINFVRTHGTLSRYFLTQDIKTGKKTDFKQHLRRLRYSLAPDRKELATNALFNKDPQMIRRLKINKSHNPDFTRSIILLLRYAAKNTRLSIKKFAAGLAMPYLFWIFLIVGLAGLRRRKHGSLFVYSVLFLLPTGIVIFATVEQRFFFIVAIILTPLMARGFLNIIRYSKRYRRLSEKENLAGLLLAVFTLFACFPGYAQNWKTTSSKDYYFQAGQWLKRELKPNNKISAAVPQAAFFAGFKYCVLPYAPLDSLDLYLQEKQVDYILIERNEQLKRPWNLNLDSLPRFLKHEQTKKIENH